MTATLVIGCFMTADTVNLAPVPERRSAIPPMIVHVLARAGVGACAAHRPRAVFADGPMTLAAACRPMSSHAADRIG